MIAPDYAAGNEVIAGFTAGLRGGRRQGRRRATRRSARPPDYQPFLTRIQQSGAKAMFCFFSGAEAITFVKQYQQFGLAGDDPAVRLRLPHRGQRARRSRATPRSASRPRCTTATSSTTRPTRRSSRPTAPRTASRPTVLRGPDLRRGRTCSTGRWPTAPTGDGASSSGARAIGDDDSPRGPWTLRGAEPEQNIYLREVEKGDGRTRSTPSCQRPRPVR